MRKVEDLRNNKCIDSYFADGYEDCLEDVWEVIYKTEMDAKTRRTLKRKLGLE